MKLYTYMFQKVFKRVSISVQKVSKGFPALFKRFSKGFPSLFKRFSKGFPSLFKRFSKDFPSLFKRFSKDFPSLFKRFSKGFPSLFKRFSKGFPSLFKRFSKGFPSLFKRLGSRRSLAFGSDWCGENLAGLTSNVVLLVFVFLYLGSRFCCPKLGLNNFFIKDMLKLGPALFQAQLSGVKTWYLRPPPECWTTCHREMQVQKYDIFV